MTDHAARKLFAPIQIGPLALSHRVVMGPLTRSRSEQPGDIPGSLMVEYYQQQLNRFGLACLHIIEPRIKGNVAIEDGLPPVAAAQLRKIFKGEIIAAGGFDPDGAEAIVEKGDADLVAFGRHFLANPDLPKRIKLGLPLNAYDRATFYTFDPHGYTDYPFYEDQEPVGQFQPRANKTALH